MKKTLFIFLIGIITFFAFAIRVFQLEKSPPAPYWEEVALGYDAYSILKTGEDHHGNSWPIVAFESFGDWKPSGYFYALLPAIALFDLTVFAVRLPSVLAGTGIVFLIGWLIYQWLNNVNEKKRFLISLSGMFLAAISPWLIQFSRAGWEVNLATFLILFGICTGWASVKNLKEKNTSFILILLALISMILSMYAYHAARVIAPVLGLFLGARYFLSTLKTEHSKIFLKTSILFVIGLMLLTPLIKSWGSPVLSQRMAETTIFSNITIIEQSNYFIGLHENTWWAKLVYHRYFFYLRTIVEQFLVHFRIDFLFGSGDAIARHSSQYFGLFYPFEIISILVGTWFIIKNFSKDKRSFMWLWLVIGIIPAAISNPVPHALRILPTAPLFIILSTIGLWQTLEWLNELPCLIKQLKNLRPYIFTSIIFLVYLTSFIAFYRHLLLVYPARFSQEWQGGYEQMIAELNLFKQQNPQLPIYITREQGRPAMYYWFYNKIDPTVVQQENFIVKKDQEEYLEFLNLHFVNSVAEVIQTPAIVVASPTQWQMIEHKDNLINIIFFDNQIWQIGINQ
ncbi:MAG: hypothetical protein COU63_03320 [Candidatus Pacebacteria bacterium CG10_big_fil_rev_8_21_14_0_10_36_11]|nr:hypothetical protein [Candidatus Pacearchaeota archaeon]PIR65019.1 MAG: hypothetical protein COU63_03320 [Candidatus Pacebacteria bacterium CG10_big_fil_rev_8_21_14_0_10_36_11]